MDDEPDKENTTNNNKQKGQNACSFKDWSVLL
jgi:hypothetical protein